jgi:hypothetical protein
MFVGVAALAHVPAAFTHSRVITGLDLVKPAHDHVRAAACRKIPAVCCLHAIPEFIQGMSVTDSGVISGMSVKIWEWAALQDDLEERTWLTTQT